MKETPQQQQQELEEVGPFTKMIEAMGFTGPLKYNKWVRVVLLPLKGSQEGL